MKQKKDKKKVGSEILVNVILDRSGSMESNKEGTRSGYNEYLKGLRQDKKAKYSITLTQFDAPMVAPELTVCYVDKPLTEVEDLAVDQYTPRGNTPLYDAIGETIRRVDAKGRPVLNVIITDGLENASQEFTKESIKKLIQEKEAEGWTFVFLGANIDSYAVSASFGIDAKNVSNYQKGAEAAMFACLASGTQAYTSMRASTGQSAQLRSESFFSDADRAKLSNVGPQPTLTTPNLSGSPFSSGPGSLTTSGFITTTPAPTLPANAGHPFRRPRKWKTKNVGS